jgi:hypothetical protein
MPRILIPLLTALLVAVPALACGGDDDNNNGETTRPSASGTRTPRETPDGTDGANGDDKSPTPFSGDLETPGPTQSVNRTPAPGGILAVAPADQAAFLQQYNQVPINFTDCTYDPSTLLTDCGDLGDYSIDPPPLGQADCQIGIVESTAEMIRCTTEEPQQTIYYDIQE